MTAPLSPAPALTAEEAARDDGEGIREHIHRDVDEFATPGHLHHWHGVGSIVAGDMGADDLRSEHRRMHASRPAEPTSEQAITDRTGATDEEFRARVAVFDAAEEPGEVVVEKLRRTIAVLRGELATSIRANGARRSKLEAVEALADEIEQSWDAEIPDVEIVAAIRAALRGDRG